MSDEIRLLGVRGYGYHGVLADEKQRGQEFVVDVVLELPTRDAGLADDLSRTVSYAEVADDVVARIAGPSVDLIETLAEQVAADALGRDLVRAVTVTVHKPAAPVGHPFGDVQVSIRRERSVPVVIALGANLGQARATLAAAVGDLDALAGLALLAVSDLVETDPVGGPDQPPYLNAVATALTALAPAPLLAALHEIEARHGRVRDVRWGARTLDLDLVQYGRPGERDEVVRDGPELTLPHPRAAERAFVLVPWAQADPTATARVGDAIRDVALLAAEADRSGVRPGPSWPPRPGPGPGMSGSP